MTEIFTTVLAAAEGEMKVFVLVIFAVVLGVTYAIRASKPPPITEEFIEKQQNALDQERAEHQALREEYKKLQQECYQKCTACEFKRSQKDAGSN